MDSTTDAPSTVAVNDLILTAKSYGSAHKYLGQILIIKNVLKTEEFCELFFVGAELDRRQKDSLDCKIESASAESIGPSGWRSHQSVLLERLLACMNERLASIRLKIDIIDDEFDDNSSYVVLHNRWCGGNDLKNFIPISDIEIRIFRGLLDSICLEGGQIHLEHAKSFINIHLMLTAEASDSLLKKFISSKWFLEYEWDGVNMLRLGPRAVVAFYGYFVTNNVKFDFACCELCNWPIIFKKASICCQVCSSVLHRQCARKLIKGDIDCLWCLGRSEDGKRCSERLIVSTNRF